MPVSPGNLLELAPAEQSALRKIQYISIYNFFLTCNIKKDTIQLKVKKGDDAWNI